MRLAFSTNAFKKNTLEEAITTLADIGYRGVEIMADVPHAYPPHMTDVRLDAIQGLLQRRGLEVSNVNAFTLFALGDTYHPTWIEPDATRLEQRIEHTRQCVELAAKLGAATVSLQPGGPLIGTELSRDQAQDRFAQALRQVLSTAQAHDIRLAIEPEPGLLIESAAEYLAFKQQYFADEPLVAMNCDTGHLYCVGEDPAQVIRQMPGQIAHVHLEDIAANRVHQHLPLGKGAIDLCAVLAALREIGYGGWITVELYPYEASAAAVAKAAWDYLQPLPQSSPARA